MSGAPWDDPLPESLEVGGVRYEIRSDYRAALDAMDALTDVDLTDQEKQYAALITLYKDFGSIPMVDYPEAVEKATWFLRGGEEPDDDKSPKLIDWKQDFGLIVPPVNRVLGIEIRAVEHLHWWSFLAAYKEIGDCLLAQVVRIRDKKARGKKLDKSEQEWYRQNRKMVDLKTTYSKAETDLLKQWGVK